MTHGFIFNFSKSTICHFVFKWLKLNCRSLVFFCKAWTFQKYKKKWKANNWKKSTFHLFINILFYLISKITWDLKNLSKRFRKRNISCFFFIFTSRDFVRGVFVKGYVFQNEQNFNVVLSLYKIWKRFFTWKASIGYHYNHSKTFMLQIMKLSKHYYMH